MSDNELRIHFATNKYDLGNGVELWTIRELRSVPILQIPSSTGPQGFQMTRDNAAVMLRAARERNTVRKIQSSRGIDL